MATATPDCLFGCHDQLLRISRGQKASSERRFLKKRRPCDVWPGRQSWLNSNKVTAARSKRRLHDGQTTVD
jgi:hypothetical protein